MAGIFLPGTSKGGDISGVTAGVGLSGGGDSGGVTLTLDLSELSAVVPTSGDWFGTLDSDDANEQLTTTDALATLFAGDGLTASSAVLAVNVDDSTIETSSDAIRIKDNGVSLAKMAGLTRGSIIYGDTSGDPAALAKGSANYVLTSDGTDIAWASAGAGAVTALNSATENEIVTVGSTTTELDAESTLTFASSKLIPTPTAHDAAGTALTVSAGATTAGTSNNQAGGALTFQGGQGKGSGAGGDIVFQTANAAGSGSSLNSLATALTLSDDLSATFAGSITTGTTVISDDSVVMTPSTNDTATIAAATNGVLNITTVDTAAAAANLNFVVDGAVDVDSAGAINLDSGSGIWTFEDSGTEMLRFTEGNSGDVTIKLETNAKDLIFTDNGDATGLTIKDAAAGIVVPGEVMTTKISFTDGDDAITIADSGITTIAKTMTFATDANIVLGDGSNVNISTPLLANADHTTTGVTAEMLAGAAISAFNVVCIHTTTQEVIVADASGYATARSMGIAPAAISDTATGTILLQGFIRDDTWNWTTGATLYLSETAGAMTETAPTTDGAFVVAIGVALEPDVVYINPSPAVIEVA